MTTFAAASDTARVLTLTEYRAVPWVVLEIAGELDLLTAAQVRTWLRETLGDIPAGQLVIDLTQVSFLDLAGLDALLDARRLVESVDGELRIVCPHERLLRLFRLTGLITTLRICQRLEEALV